ncbi:MAG: PIN domain-containing protein [Gammaproteobacteria bacterium]|nr:PIN domain-containing protein [Gammaproteobacteria bacterium]
MCAILDNDVCGEVFGNKRTPAGTGFLDWLDSSGHLVSGGQNKRELDGNSTFQVWWQQATLAGRTTLINQSKVNQLQQQLEDKQECRSNDAHIIALARISGARLLYSNDRDLTDDFRDRGLVPNPRGRVYSTNVTQDFNPQRRNLLRQSRCQKPRSRTPKAHVGQG